MRQIVTFVVMWLVGIFLNPMNFLAYSWDHLYVSKTLVYIGFLMAANMVWIHEIIQYVYGGCSGQECGTTIVIGLLLTAIAVFLMRNQVWIGPKDWMTRMIPHHSTALTTSEMLIRNHRNTLTKQQQKLATNIIGVQKEEIRQMKDMLQS